MKYGEKIIYPEKIYSLQSKILVRYHDTKTEVFYRGDDIWSIAKENQTTNTSLTYGTELKPYYTLIKNKQSLNDNLGLIIPYTPKSKQNLNAYLIGTYENNKLILNLYKFGKEDIILRNESIK